MIFTKVDFCNVRYTVLNFADSPDDMDSTSSYVFKMAGGSIP